MSDRDQIEQQQDEEDFAAMLEESLNESDESKITKGVVISVSDQHVVVDVGEKVEGRINIEEFQDAEGNVSIKEGEEIPVLITGHRNERPVVSHKKALHKEKVHEYIESLGEQYEDKVIEAPIVRKNKGGYILEKDGIEFFMPRYLSALKDDNSAIGKEFQVCIINIKPEEDSIIVSRKRFFELDRGRKKEVIDELMKKNEPVHGKIKKITSFGMFVEIAEGVEGLVHYTEISYKGPTNPAKYFQEGDEVVVVPLSYDEEKRRLSLSIKATMQDPWDEIKEELETGDAIEVTVSNMEPYGAFVDLGNDIEGFLHISEISWDKNIKHPEEYLEMGKKLNVEVIEIDSNRRRLRVSLKRLQPKPFEEFNRSHKEGEIVEGEVTTLTDFGAFVKIGKVEGLLHNEDAFWSRSEKCKDQFKPGDKLEVKIAKVDRERERISLSRKGVIPSPAEEFEKSYKIDDIVKGTIRDIKDFGVFVNLSESVDALIRNEDLAPLKKEELNAGDEIEGVISMIDGKSNKIRISVKRLERQKEKENLEQFSDESSMTLGDRIKGQL